MEPQADEEEQTGSKEQELQKEIPRKEKRKKKVKLINFR